MPYSIRFKRSRMVIRGVYSSVAVTGEKEGPLALRRGYITQNVPTVSYRHGLSGGGWSRYTAHLLEISVTTTEPTL